MKTSSIQVGNFYEVQAGRNKTKVKVVSFDATKESWQCETPNGKTISIKDTARFLSEMGVKQKTAVSVIAPTTARGPKPLGNMSVLAAAHRVLQEEQRPMKVREIMETALGKGYCKVGGKTPFNTFNGGMRMEIAKKGKDSRFQLVGRGLFAFR